MISVNNKKIECQNFLKNTLLKERQKIFNTNPRSQKRDKDIILAIYDDIIKPFSPLSKSDNGQPDEQPETANIPELESEKSVAQRRNQVGKNEKAAAQEKQSAKRLKKLTPSQMLSRLSVILAKLNSGNNSKNIKKMKLRNYCILCTSYKKHL